jgi:hypothetical protein
MKATIMESLEDKKWSMWLRKLVVVGLVVACALPFANIGADAASSSDK